MALPSDPTMLGSSRHNLASNHAGQEPSLRAIPLLAGSNADELLPSIPRLQSLGAYRQLLRAQLGEARAAEVMERYFTDGERLPRDSFARAYTDARYGCQARRTAGLPSAQGAGAETGAAPRFRYLLDRPLDDPGQAELGSYHGLDLIYLFGTFEELGYVPTAADRQFSAEFMQHYAAFARSGDPSLPEWEWLPDTDERRWVANLADTPTLEDDPRAEHCDFWLSE